jgi:hypothetical protein
MITKCRQGLLEEGQRRSIRRATGLFTGLRAGRGSGKPLPSCRYCRTFPATTGRQGAADVAVDYAGAAVPFEELRARRISRRAMLDYTAASGRLDQATFWERADASVRCTGLGVKLYMPRSDEAQAVYLFINDAKIVLR